MRDYDSIFAIAVATASIQASPGVLVRQSSDKGTSVTSCNLSRILAPITPYHLLFLIKAKPKIQLGFVTS